MALKKSRKRAAEIPRRRKTEETKEEPVEAMKKLGCGGSAKKVYSVSPYDYQLLEDIGQGSSATVFRALYIPYNEIVAVKCLDLDRSCSNLDDIRREAQTMSLIDHPNVVKGYCSFIVEHSLWVVMPFMSEGSCFHLMKAAYPDGLEEHIIGVVLKETLKALEYLHKHGNIHRDVKAGNILLDRAGAVKLSDFGITAGMFDQGDRKHSRNTFVGTPCWMAPEVMQPGGGYDFKADIWSFGITALELAHGHAPFSKYPPMKVLLMTLQNAPPGLDYDRDKKFSKSFKEMVAMCLVKDQTKRPSAEKLLKHSFFKNVKSLDIFMKSLLADLPPLWDRVKELQLKDAEKLALNRMPSSEQEALSKSEYQKGVSAWNFDIEDLKVQASLIIDDDDIVETKEVDGSLRNIINYKCEHETATFGYTSEKSVASDRNSVRQNFREAEVSAGGILFKKSEEPDILEDSNLDDPSRCDKVKLSTDSETSTSMHDTECRWKSQVRKKSQIYSGPLLSSNMQINSSEIGRPFESQLLNEGSRYDWKALGFSGPLMIPNRASANSLSAPTVSLRGSGDSLDNSRASVIQIKGRFSVTSENVDFVKVLPLAKSASVSDGISDPKQVVLPLAKSASVSDGISDPKQVAKLDSTEGEHLLLDEISELQARMINLNDELTAARIKHSQFLKWSPNFNFDTESSFKNFGGARYNCCPPIKDLDRHKSV